MRTAHRRRMLALRPDPRRSLGSDLSWLGQGEAALCAEAAVDQGAAAELGRGLEVAQHLDLDAQDVSDPYPIEDAEVVDRCEVARLRRVVLERREERAPTLGE